MRALYPGAVLALAAGLLTGVAMRPQLAVDDRPVGPQMLAGRAGARAAGSFDDGPSFASGSGAIPAYGPGTGAQTPVPTAAAPEPAAETYYVSPIGDEPPEPPVPAGDLTAAAYGVPTAEHVAYPSLDGGAAYDDASRAEKTPVLVQPVVQPIVQPADIDDEAPPEATGDTRVAR